MCIRVEQEHLFCLMTNSTGVVMGQMWFKKQEEMQSISVSVLLLLLKENLGFHWNFWICK